MMEVKTILPKVKAAMRIKASTLYDSELEMYIKAVLDDLDRLSFYHSLVYLCTRAVNEVEAFRYALRGEDLVLFDRRNPSFTDLKPGAEQFHIVTLPMEENIQTFCAAAKAKSAAQTSFLDQEDSLDLIYFTCLPWVELTALTNERDFDPGDAVPRIAWGKYAREGERKVLHISLELNHRFVEDRKSVV